MASNFTIQLTSLEFYAAHGLYAEEGAVGNAFTVNISMTVKAPKETVKSLDETLDYGEVYRITKEIFSVRNDLLETLAMQIAGAVKQQFPMLQKISVQIIKNHPPISGFTGAVSVTFNKSFRE